MAVYNVTSPDGRSFKINAPAGTSEEELFEYVQSQYYTQQQPDNRPEQEPVEYGTENSYESENAPWYQDVADVGVGFVSGVSKAAGALVGLGSYVPGLHYIADPVAEGLQDFGGFIDESLLSDRQKEINKELATRLAEVAGDLPENATFDDYMDAMKAGGGEAYEYIKDHPTQVLNLIAASAPYILGGGVISKGLKGGADLAGFEKASKLLKTPYVGGAAGEGMIVGGQVVTDMIEATGSSGEYSAERLKALGTIPVTTALSLLGGRVTKLAKGIDPDTAVAGKIVTGKSLFEGKTGSGVLNTVYKTGVGAAVEGLEETAQSGSEKYWENYAANPGYNMLDPKLTLGIGEEAVLGGATGAGQGGLINLGAGLISNQDAGNSEIEVTPDLQEIKEFEDAQDAKDGEVVQQTEEMQQQEQENRELRVLHSATFPNEKEWNKINKQDDFEEIRIQIADPTSKYGKDFRVWQEITDDGVIGKYDTEPDTEPGTTTPLAETVRKYLGKQATTTEPGLYRKALDDYAAFKKYEVTESAEDAADIKAKMAELFKARGIALKNNSMEDLAKVNMMVAEYSEKVPHFEARWKDYLRNAAKEPKIPAGDVPDDLEDAVVSDTEAAKKEAKKVTKKDEKPVTYDSDGQAVFSRSKEQVVEDAKNYLESQKKKKAEENEAVDDTEAVETNETMVDILNRDLHENKLSKEKFEKKHPGFKDLWGVPREITQDDVNLRGEPAQVLGDFGVKKDSWQYKLVTFLLDASKRGVLSDYVSFKSSMAYVVKKGDTRESIAAKFDSSVEEIFPKAEKVKKKVRSNNKKAKIPKYRVEYSDAEVVPLTVNSRIQIPLTKKIFASLPIEEKYKAARWDMVKLSDELGIIDPNTNEPYLSEKGKQNVKDALSSYRKKHQEAGEDTTSARELITRTLERTAFAEAYSGNETSADRGADLEFEQTATATQESQTTAEEFDPTKIIERGDRPTRETTKGTFTEEDISGWATRDTGDVTPIEEISQKSDEATDTQILTSPENFKVGTVNDAKAKQQVAAEVIKLKAEARNLKGAATRAETSLSKAQNKLSKARAKTRIAELTKEVRRLKSAATKKRNIANKAVEAVQEVEGFKTITDKGRVKLQREFDKRDTELPGTAKLETLEQQERAKKERIASAENILKGFMGTLIEVAAIVNPTQAQFDTIKERTEQHKALISTWNDNKSKDAPTFTDLTIPQQLEWADRVLLAVHDEAPKDIPNQQKLMEGTLDDYNEGPTAQSKEVAARRKQADKQNRDRKLKLSRERDTKKISTKTAAEEYGKAKLNSIYGTFWRSHKDNSILKTHLRNKDWIKYQSFVDKRVAAFKAMTKKEQREWTALNVRPNPVKRKGKKSKGYADSFLDPPRTENWGLLNSNNPKKKENLENMFRRLLGDKGYRRIRNRVYYFNDVQEARRQLKEDFSEAESEVKSEAAFVMKWRPKNGQPDTIAFILNRLREGSEESTFVHEVAGHIGLDNVLTDQERRAIQVRIVRWSIQDKIKYGDEAFYDLDLKDMLDVGWKVGTSGYMIDENGQRIKIADSTEHLAARYAVRKAHGKGYEKEFINTKTGEQIFKVPDDVLTAETLAYFLEVSVQLGVKPSQTTDTGKILYKMKRAMMKFLNYFGKISDFNMTAQDFMDMALGLAKVDLESGFRFGEKPQSQKVIKEIRTVTANTKADNIYTGRRPTMKDVHIDSLNMSEEEFSKTHPDFADQWKPMKGDNYVGAYLDSLETKATQRFAQQPSDTSDVKNWAAEIDAAARRKFPKDKGKYVPNDGSRVPLAEWGNFQKAQHRREKAYRAAAKLHIEQMLRDAAENEARMADPEGNSYKRFTIEENDRSREEAKKNRQEVKENFPALLSMYDTLAEGLKSAQKSMRFKGDFINKYQEQLPGLKEAADVILASRKLARNIKKSVDNIAVLERVLKPERRKIVNKLIEVATSKQLWPSQMRPTKDKDGNEVPRRKITVGVEFKKLFEKMLTQGEQDLVMQVFEHGEDMIQMYREISKELGLEKDFFSIAQLEGPYAPLRRFGKHTVTLRSQTIIDLENKLEEGELPPAAKRLATTRLKELRSNGKHFWYEHFPNAGQAKRFQRAQKKTGNWGDTSYAKKAVALGDRGTADQKVLEQINAALNLSEMDSIAKAQFKRIIDEIYTASIQESNARQGQQLRQNIKGAEQNMLRSFVVNASSEANLISNLKFGREINVAIATVSKNANEIDKREDTPDGEMRSVYNMLANHYNIRLRKQHHPVVDSVASFITAWLLTTSLSYHLQNGTQTIAVAVPIIAADFKSYSKVMNQLPKSYRIGHNVISYDKKIPFIGSKRATWTLNINLEALREEDHWALPILALLDEMEILDLGIEQDLNDTHTQDTGFKGIDKGIRVAGTVSHRLYQVPRGVEAYNRIATALTAYRLALDNPSRMRAMGYRGKDKKGLESDALNYAIKKTQDTQGDFTADGAPYALKWVLEHIPGGKLVMQYKKFPLLMIWNYSRSVNMIWAGESKEQRAIGWRATRNLFAHTMVLSGLRGLPLITAIYASTVYYAALFGDDDEDDKDSNPKLTDGAFERAIIEAFPDNPKLAEAIYRSPITALLGVDTSMKLSHDKIFNPLPFTDFEISEEGFKDIGVGLMGPFGNVAMNMAIAGEHFTNGNTYRGIEMIMPKGLRDPMEAWRFHTEGYTNRKSRVKAPPTDFKTMDILLKALGIPSREIGKLKWKSSEQYQIRNFFSNREVDLINQYEKAEKKNDKKVMDSLKTEWYALQDGKDNIRHFYNFAPSAIPHRSVDSMTDASLRKMKWEEDTQEEMGTGMWKDEEDGNYGAKFNN